jgi:glycosyltransferase involved in cell wall biosynthesis
VRIVVFTTSYPRAEGDYAGSFILTTVRALEARGHEVRVVRPGVYRHYGLADNDGTGIAGAARKRPWLAPPLLSSMLRALRREARFADVVHMNWLLSAPLARFLGKPWVITLHGSASAGSLSDLELMRRFPALVRFLLRPAEVICVGAHLEEACRGIGLQRVVTIRNPIMPPRKRRRVANPPYILYVGRLAPEKGIEVLAKATAGLPLRVVGDGPLRRLLPSEACLGSLPHDRVLEQYASAACLVLSSHEEGSPTVVLEAMRAGCPVAATAVGDLPFVIADGKNGYLVAPGDADGLRARLVRLLEDPSTRNRLGAAARRRAAELSDPAAVVAQIESAYRRAIEGKNGIRRARGGA